MTFAHISQQIFDKKSYLCVGLDTDVAQIPAYMQAKKNAVLEFNKAIIDATKNYCVAYKINTAFYEAMGAKGWEIMQETFDYIPNTHFKIADAKRGDIGNTSHQYAKAFFETMGADAITVAPYMGFDSIRPFLEYANKWTIVLALTSNAGSADFQRLRLAAEQPQLQLVPNLAKPTHSHELYQQVLEKVSSWGTVNNLMFVVGATQSSELAHIRTLVPEHFLLVPGVGFQGGSLADISRHGLTPSAGLLVNASRAIIYASEKEDFAEAAAEIALQYQSEMARFLG
ncbi:MAG: orotidine-5'-phosphate decarboxylase [Bacteroidetes bacterium]|nr:MAG: orotidine-5'-phosphate decarboxylase [Bacteroidota bacterium]